MPDAVAAESTSVRSRTFAALENPQYRRFYAGQGISLIGTWVQAAAVKWIVFDRTHSEFMLGLIEAANLLPGLLVGLTAGAIADRVVPRGMILAMETGQMLLAFALAILVGLGVVTIWQLALILALARICVTFEVPCRQVFLYDLVGRPDLPNAIALNSGLFNASRVLGPMLAGLCLSTLGATACFALNGVSFVAALAALASIRLDRRRSPQGEREPFGGFAYLRDNRRVAILFVLMAFFGVVGMGYDAMIPAYARRVLNTGVRGYSILLSSSGIGATCGALAMASLGGLTRKERLVLSGLVIFAVSLAAASWFPAFVGQSWPGPARLIVASGCLFGIGFGAVVFYAGTQTLVQAAVPDHLRGRLMGIWMIVYSGSVPLGALWTGHLAEARGVTSAMGFAASLCLAVALVGFASGMLIQHPHRVSSAEA